MKYLKRLLGGRKQHVEAERTSSKRSFRRHPTHTFINPERLNALLSVINAQYEEIAFRMDGRTNGRSEADSPPNNDKQ
jgi:hypothetical protein